MKSHSAQCYVYCAPNIEKFEARSQCRGEIVSGRCRFVSAQTKREPACNAPRFEVILIPPLAGGRRI
jgi:hypothetical protein